MVRQPRWRVHEMVDGSRLVLIPVAGSDTFYVQFVVSLGSRHSAGPDDFEMPHLLEHLFASLTSSRHPSAEKNEKDLAQRGIRMNALTYDTRTRFYFRGEGDEHLSFVVGRLLDAYSDFRIDLRVMDKEKQAVVNELNQHLSDPTHVLSEHLDRFLYQDFPASQYTMDKAKRSCLRTTPDQLMSLWRSYYAGSSVVFTVCGRFDQKRVLRQFERRIRRNKTVVPPSFRTPIFFRNTSDVVLRSRPDASETNHVRVLWHTRDIPYLSLEYHTLFLIDCIMVATCASRLLKRLRVDLGMIYSIDSVWMSDDSGHTVYGFSTSVYKDRFIRPVIREIRRQCMRLCRTPVDPDEMLSIRNQASMTLLRDNEDRLDPYFWIREYSENIRTNIPIISRSDLHKHYMTLTPTYLQNVANKVFSGSTITQIGFKKQ